MKWGGAVDIMKWKFESPYWFKSYLNSKFKIFIKIEIEIKRETCLIVD